MGKFRFCRDSGWYFQDGGARQIRKLYKKGPLYKGPQYVSETTRTIADH